MKKFLIAIVFGLAVLCCGFIFQPVVTVSANAQEVVVVDDVADVVENIDEEENVEVLSSDTKTISGTVYWVDRNNSRHPLIFVKVNFYNAYNNALLGTVYTDVAGEYSFSFAKGCSQICIEVRAENSNITVANADGDIYYRISDPINVPYSIEYDLDFDMEDEFGQALQISQAAIIASKYVESMGRNALPLVTVYYPHQEDCGYGIGEHCFYRPTYDISGEQVAFGEIFITNNRGSSFGLFPYEAWDEVMHEYGHHVGECLKITDNPGGEHSLDINLAEEYGYDRGCRLAWGEGFATIFGSMAQEYYVDYLSADDNSIISVADGQYTPSGGIMPYSAYEGEATADFGGAGYEYTVIQILWDMYDRFNYSDMRSEGSTAFQEEDKFNLGHDLWFLLSRAQAHTLNDFINYVTSNNTDVAMTRNMAYLLDGHGMCATDLVWGMEGNLPSLSWGVGGGANERYQNKLFSLFFYDIYGSVTYVIENLMVETGELVVQGNGRVEYTLTSLQWNNVIYTYGTSFEVSIFGKQLIEETNMVLMRGGYMSVELSIEKPPRDGNFQKSFLNTPSCWFYIFKLSPGSTLSFRVYWCQTANMIVQTFGGIDTVLEVYDEDTGELLNSDDDSGYGYNAFVSFLTDSYSSYIIKLRYIGGAYGQTKLAFTPLNGIASSSAIQSYDDFLTVQNTEQVNLTIGMEQFHAQAIVFIPPSSGTYQFRVASSYQSIVFVIDPRTSAALHSGVEYIEAGSNGGEAVLEILLDAQVPYLIIFGANNLSAITEGGAITLGIEKIE